MIEMIAREDSGEEDAQCPAFSTSEGVFEGAADVVAVSQKDGPLKSLVGR